MMRSLFAGVSGLKTHQVRMDVIGNNIANVNTTAYKSSSMTFSELMSQTTQKASGANTETGTGGVNPRQIGLGVKTGAINTNITGQGAAQSTGNPFDIMIEGQNFFVVNNGLENLFTRSGSFYVDGAGNLAMTSNGYNVMGWGVDTATMTIRKNTVSALRIMHPDNMTYPPDSTTLATVSGLVDRNDTDVSSTAGKTINLNFFDNLGYSYTAKMALKQNPADVSKYTVTVTSIIDSTGAEVANSSSATLGGNAISTGVELAYDPANGKFSYVGTAGSQSAVLGLTTVSSNFKDIAIDFSKTQMFDNKGASTIGAVRGDANGLGSGRRQGDMIGVTIQNNGMIYATYDNGQTKLLGQIATAAFANASGLEKRGDNLYTSTLNSGEFDGIGVDVTANGGSMATGQLEMSNVDLSAEFTEMITTQRGFQANSRIITVSDTLLEELTNLKR